jgi:hypothetical protein
MAMQQAAQQQAAQQQAAQQQAAQQQAAQQLAAQQQAAQQQLAQQQAAQQLAAQQQAAQQSTQQPSQQPPSSALTVVTGMPPVIPVQSPTPNDQQMTSMQAQSGLDASSATLAVENEKLAAQLQSDVVKKMNDYQSQNKNLLDQVEVLNSRIAGMETQMTQLVQTLSHQNQAQQGAVANMNTSLNTGSAQPPQAAEPRVAFNVQAIIPGRAWLRSDGGETVTVAEGDVVKELGRVTKIDPYDGVVEINTGTRVVSLSYGNGS